MVEEGGEEKTVMPWCGPFMPSKAGRSFSAKQPETQQKRRKGRESGKRDRECREAQEPRWMDSVGWGVGA